MRLSAHVTMGMFIAIVVMMHDDVAVLSPSGQRLIRHLVGLTNSRHVG